MAYNDSVFKKFTDSKFAGYRTTARFYVATVSDLPNEIKILRKINDSICILQINNKAEFDFVQARSKIAAANITWKLSPALENAVEKETGIKKYILSGLSIDSLLGVISKSKELAILTVNRPSNSLLVKASAKYLLENVIGLNEIIFFDEYKEPQTEISIIGYNRSFHGINGLDYLIPGANGKNIVAGIKEQKMDETDMDIYKRVLPSSIAANNIENHATVITSVVGGAGNSFYSGRGIASGCKFFPSSFSNLFADDAAILNSSKVTVQNHSYGTVIQQFYGAEAVSYDMHAWQNQNFVHVFSAGNSGLSVAANGQYANIPGYANLTGNFKMAKNIITVGAISNTGIIAAESSSGPVYDGRLAPQLIALGPNGTSDAAAIVTGTIAVMQQVYADSNNQLLPPASLTKAVLFNTAEDIYKTAIDYKTGYGLVNSFAAIKSLQQKKYDGGILAHNQEWTKTIFVPANTAQLKITLAWTDSASTVNNNKAILNDLDLEVKELNSGFIYKPWVLSAVANIDSLGKLPVRKRDSLNTAEQVTIQLPAAGDYQVKVKGTNVLSSSLPFHIAYNIDTLNTFSFINPQHTSDVNREENENLVIKWKTFVADTNQTGNLYISYNNGVDWRIIGQAIKIFTNQFNWQVKDTSSAATLKMETSFGNFFSKDFIITKVTRPTIDFLCIDSFQISWPKHIYANGYTVFSLTDSAYLKPIITVTDTFTVFKRANYPSVIYAVEPVLSNHIPAARSIALNIELQGVKCFYKTLNYNLLDNNELNLILELSAAGYTDSVSFEEVNIAGQLIQTYGGAKVQINNHVYVQFVNDLKRGTTYFRGRIKLKSGAVVYTNIISVITSGKQKILFYPNPANRNHVLNYVLQQGIPADSRLQLFDITGRMVKDFLSLPAQIDISGLSPGLFIYKLFDDGKNAIETGKIIIR